MIPHSFISENLIYSYMSSRIRYLLIFMFVLLLISIFIFYSLKPIQAAGIGSLKVRSIDTMKFSRDTARKEANNTDFDKTIEKHISQIASLNATYVAIDTPYDKEFVPFLRRWVKVARKYKLKVWFRGNLSGWEKWFDYPQINSATRFNNIKNFIEENKDLFEDGDIFTSCPECENGSIDVYQDPQAYKKFLMEEYQMVKRAFSDIGIKVIANYNSMNGDIANLIMDEATTKSMGGIVTVDHYIHSQEKLVSDLDELAEKSRGKIVLGEVGAPLADIHGDMTEVEQRNWIAELFVKLDKVESLEGINYWLSYGGSTALWDPDGRERLAAEVVRNAYAGRVVKGKLVDRKGQIITDAEIIALNETYLVDQKGVFSIPYLYEGQIMEISAKGYPAKSQVAIKENTEKEYVLDFEINDSKSQNSLWDKVLALLSYPIRTVFYLLTGKKQ